jgi:hypothetical protein
MRHLHRVDTAQQEIVDGLRSAGYRVEIIGRPVDLLVGKVEVVWDTEPVMISNTSAYGSTHDRWKWTPMEVKTPTKSGKRRKRTDQADQDAFIAETGTPVVKSLEEALTALNGL